ncbi:MAG TPA: hypothetical protein VFD89_05610 [Clostridia bacterium]|nr:hypothetical protein [Clostridia bacterium]
MRNITISFVGKSGSVLSHKKLLELPLRNEFIIGRSIEYFNDPEPCMIHRSAVIKRIYMELFDYLGGIYTSREVEMLWDILPQKFRKAIDIPQEPHLIRFSFREDNRRKR